MLTRCFSPTVVLMSLSYWELILLDLHNADSVFLTDRCSDVVKLLLACFGHWLTEYEILVVEDVLPEMIMNKPFLFM